MGKQIIDMIGGIVEITGNSTIDTILLCIIGVISFAVAFGLVGRIFDSIGFYDSDIMSNVHWGIRITVFVGLTHICIKVIKFITWLLNSQWWVFLIGFLIIILSISIIYILKYNFQKRKNACNNENAQKNENVEKDENIERTIVQTTSETEKKRFYDRFVCPRCGGQLVKRHGPYGDFYGCESYAVTGCRYTRNKI